MGDLRLAIHQELYRDGVKYKYSKPPYHLMPYKDPEERRAYQKTYFRNHHADKLAYHRDYYANHREKWGSLPWNENKSCSHFLGGYAELVLSKEFSSIERMPFNNRGYDFKCSHNKRIDVKSSCRRNHGRKNESDFYQFTLRRNPTADAFLLLAFNNRKDLKPEHVWLVPASLVRHLMQLTITTTSESMAKWAQFERPLDHVNDCCGKLTG
jgi:hypothetical protein